MKTFDEEDIDSHVIDVVIGLFAAIFGFIGYTAFEAWVTYMTRLPC